MNKQSVLTIRLEEELKNEFTALCKKFGMSATTALTIYVRAVVRSRCIPFEIADETIEVESLAQNRENKKGNAQIQELTSKLLGAIVRGGNSVGLGGKERGKHKSKSVK